jgi:hypothetical protein
MNDYDYDYHNLAENSDFMDEDECYYDDGTSEPWAENDDGVVFDKQDQYQNHLNKYDAYYHDIADELDD